MFESPFISGNEKSSGKLESYKQKGNVIDLQLMAEY